MEAMGQRRVVEMPTAAILVGVDAAFYIFSVNHSIYTIIALPNFEPLVLRSLFYSTVQRKLMFILLGTPRSTEDQQRLPAGDEPTKKPC
jgi:hypothetical protein